MCVISPYLIKTKEIFAMLDVVRMPFSSLFLISFGLESIDSCFKFIFLTLRVLSRCISHRVTFQNSCAFHSNDFYRFCPFSAQEISIPQSIAHLSVERDVQFIRSSTLVCFSPEGIVWHVFLFRMSTLICCWERDAYFIAIRHSPCL